MMGKRKAFLYLTVLAILSTLIASCRETHVSEEEQAYGEQVYEEYEYVEELPSRDVRILLLKNVKEARIAIYSPYKFIQGSTILAGGNTLTKQLLRYNNGKFSIGGRGLGSGKIRIVTQKDGAIELNRIRYHGNLLLLPNVGHGKGSNKFSVIELTDIEEYLAGVIGSEMPSSWNYEALRAQAIIARTFALYQRNKHGDTPYHIDGLDLAYQGLKNEKKKLNVIVEETRGIVMLYNTEVFSAYFHSTCGGRTEDASLIFNQDSIPPLRGVKCGFCSASKYYNWQTVIKKTFIEKKLRTINPGIANIHTIQPAAIGPGNHSAMVKIRYTGGTKKMNANKFRLLMGSKNLRSTAFNAENKGRSIKFSGRGWGHGVGLCQYGAQGMAKKGYKWSEILKHYYPEIEIKRIY
ncbi:MAG: SpoIID/LytB domain-containing protein [Candidatus Brocadiales bacterium]